MVFVSCRIVSYARASKSSHYATLLVHIARAVIFNTTLNLICPLLLFDFLGKVLLHVLLKFIIEVHGGSFQDNISPA